MCRPNCVKRAISLLIAVCMLNISVYASTLRMSEYLGTCTATASSSSNGGISIAVIIKSMDSQHMSKIGVDSILIQQSTNKGRTWSDVTTVYPSMSGSGTSYKNTQVVYTGTAGVMYRAVVTCIAKNANGSDTKDITTNSVTARK